MIHAVGLVFNILAGIMYGLGLYLGQYTYFIWIYYLSEFMQVCILVSCVFIFDAFRRLNLL